MFSHNEAGGMGGAIEIMGGHETGLLMISRCDFVSNVAHSKSNGGAIKTESSSLVISESTFTANTGRGADEAIEAPLYMDYAHHPSQGWSNDEANAAFGAAGRGRQ